MKINFGVYSFTVDVDSYAPHFESGIEWTCIGGVWQAVDHGAATDHYSTTVTISGTIANIHTVRDVVITSLKTSGILSIICDDSEKIFGHEFFYQDFIYSCLVSEKEEPFVSTAPEGTYLATWKITLLALNDMPSRRRYWPTSFPANLYGELSRTASPHAVTTTLYRGYHQADFNTSQPTCTLKYFGTSEEIGRAKIWLINKRRTMFNLTSQEPLYYFEYGVASNDVYFFDLTDEGSVDYDSSRAELSVTYLRAQHGTIKINYL